MRTKAILIQWKAQQSIDNIEKSNVKTQDSFNQDMIEKIKKLEAENKAQKEQIESY